MKWSNSASYEEQRRAMVERQLRARGIHDPRVLETMLQVPRHQFVAPEFQVQAYADYPLPIGAEQTISQPFIIAVALQALGLTGTESVLEVGTGSGYQTALLARMARQVYSVERHAELAEKAHRTLRELGFGNIKISVRDGSQGWPDYSPYDAILVSAAAPSLPRSLVEQLGEGGKMVIPVGPAHAQELQLVRRKATQITSETVEGCRFVPLVGVEGY
ncbi:MAG TPA: protein-L-isoaspartate(D-aspartate) O-methyltransferase [Terriglobales bacterium]|jgi:protein-L-isoaspartate(D-aspartate) O-methyltransferase|nr:protein-L-isoaspartate(D-aspartate) O-methyltransferase [Terriglobales bacterium]